MQETTRADLLRTTDPEIIASADVLQGHLLLYRLQNYHKLKLPPIAGYERLRSREHEINSWESETCSEFIAPEDRPLFDEIQKMIREEQPKDLL